MILKKLIIICIFLYELFVVHIWLGCIKLQDTFLFSQFDAQLKTEYAIGNDVGYPPVLARLFHNKIIIYTTEIINKYFSFWNTQFGALFFSIVGYFGIICGFYYLIFRAKKSLKVIGVLVVLLLIPFIQVFNIHIPFMFKLFVLIIPYYLLSAYGLWEFIRLHKRYGVIIVILLFLISLWYGIIFQKDIFVNFCYNK